MIASQLSLNVLSSRRSLKGVVNTLAHGGRGSSRRKTRDFAPNPRVFEVQQRRSNEQLVQFASENFKILGALPGVVGLTSTHRERSRGPTGDCTRQYGSSFHLR